MERQGGGIVARTRPLRITNARAAEFASRGGLFCRDMVTAGPAPRGTVARVTH